MKLHEVFFWAISFFLVGVLVASITYGFSQVYAITGLVIFLLAAIVWLLKRPALSLGIALVCFSFLILGVTYYFLFNHFQKPTGILFDQKVRLTGIIVEAEQRLETQKLVVRSENDVKIGITTQRYPAYEYGEKISVEGIISQPKNEFRGYYLKEGIAGTMSYGKITVLEKRQGSPIKAALFEIRGFVDSSYKKVLPLEKAAFLSGLTIGSTAEFSKEFTEKLRATGTSHLVALSGYNIAVIIISFSLFLGSFRISQKWQFPIITLFVIAFVVMTGAEASVVRAAIMAFLILFAERVGRIYYFRNAVAATALAMVLYNPNVLAFDIGFQLSFAALLGIVYLAPWLREKLRMKRESGIFSWREHFLNTTSAQLAVLPLLLYHFGYASPLGVASNLFILEFVPITMLLGFVIATLYPISGILALILSWPTSVLLGYMLSVINIFTKTSHFIGF